MTQEKLANSIREQFIRVRHFDTQDVETSDGWRPYKRYCVELYIGQDNFEVYHSEKEVCEGVAKRLAASLARMIWLLGPNGSLPIDYPHFLIVQERQRQIDKGFTPQHDDLHNTGELAAAASLYAMPPQDRTDDAIERLWPFDDTDFEPCEDRLRELEKAGAMIVAEMVRLDRMNVATKAEHARSVASQIWRRTLGQREGYGE